MAKYRIVLDNKYRVLKYVVERDDSIWNGLFGRTWGYVSSYETLKEAEKRIEQELTKPVVIAEYGT